MKLCGFGKRITDVNDNDDNHYDDNDDEDSYAASLSRFVRTRNRDRRLVGVVIPAEMGGGPGAGCAWPHHHRETFRQVHPVGHMMTAHRGSASTPRGVWIRDAAP